MTCSAPTCGMPAAGLLMLGANPHDLVERRPLCRGHLVEACEHHIEGGQIFSVAPWRVIVDAGSMAA